MMLRQISPHGFKKGAGKPTDSTGQRHDSRPEKALEKAQGRTNAPTDTVLGPSSAGSINVTPASSGATGDRADRLFSGILRGASMPYNGHYQQTDTEATR
jgi:hypothetical protein